MLFRPLLLIAALASGPLAAPAHASAGSNDFRPLARDASFFRNVLRHAATAEGRAAVAPAAKRSVRTGAAARAAADKVDDDGSPTATYAGGAAVLGIVAYFLASSNGDHDLLAPNRDDEGDVTLPTDDPFVPPQPEHPAQPNQPGTPGDQGTGNPDGPGDQGGPGSGDGEQELVPDPTTVTPEPISMSLVASGLAGMGIANLRRRRRRTS